jgi:hypothetical protein
MLLTFDANTRLTSKDTKLYLSALFVGHLTKRLFEVNVLVRPRNLEVAGAHLRHWREDCCCPPRWRRWRRNPLRRGLQKRWGRSNWASFAKFQNETNMSDERL